MLKQFHKAIIEAGAEIYEVGGTVRDRILGRQRKDYDYLVRKISMDKVISILKPYGKVALVGKSFGVIKFSPHNEPDIETDIALPRKEFSTGVGHRDFDVDFDPTISVDEDLGRRDFTINAMAYDLATSKLIDPFGGEADLKRSQLKQVFPRAFEDDPLRMLRGVQFAARFDLEIEPVTLSSMKNYSNMITTVSAERVMMELVKLMRARLPSKGIAIMLETGLLKIVFPEVADLKGIEQDKQPGDDVYNHTMKVLDAAASDPMVENTGSLELKFAALLHDIGKKKTKRYNDESDSIVFFGHQIVSARMAQKRLNNLKAYSSGVDINLVCHLIENHMFETKAYFSERAIRRFVSKIGKENIFMLLDLRLADNRGGKHPYSVKGVMNMRKRIRDELAKKPPFGPKDLKINGNDLMEIGFEQGPVMGRVLSRLVDLVLDNPELNEKDKLLAFAKNLKENEDDEIKIEKTV